MRIQNPMRYRYALIAVGKQPLAGTTKTRLCPPLTAQQASELYECLLLDTLALMRQVPGVQQVVAYDPPAAFEYFKRHSNDFDLLPQVGHDLGARLDNALTQYLRAGYEGVAIMNTDGPTLPVTSLCMAFGALRGDADVVLGPSDDGGYYLIGIKRPAPRLLREVRMSTPATAEETLALAKGEGLRVVLLPPWYDVDDGQSLLRLAMEVSAPGSEAAPRTRQYLQSNPGIVEVLP